MIKTVVEKSVTVYPYTVYKQCSVNEPFGTARGNVVGNALCPTHTPLVALLPSWLLLHIHNMYTGANFEVRGLYAATKVIPIASLLYMFIS